LYQQAHQEISEHIQAEAELQRYKTHLEEQVAARTTELTRMNLELQAEIIERKDAEEKLTVARDQALAASRLKTELFVRVNNILNRLKINAKTPRC
jgi:C4-dicarboxylate-specific signal transduction histidine kinase